MVLLGTGALYGEDFRAVRALHRYAGWLVILRFAVSRAKGCRFIDDLLRSAKRDQSSGTRYIHHVKQNVFVRICES
jgi:hypothetical protein